MDEKRLEEVERGLGEFVTEYLRKSIAFTENSDGSFTADIYPDYRDEVSDKAIAEMLAAEDPRQAFGEAIVSMYEPSMEYIEQEAVEGIRGLMEKAGGLTSDDGDCDFLILDALRERVQFSFPDGHFLRQEVCVDLVIDTGDGNGDFIANSVPMYPPGYWGHDVIPDEASLVWLCGTQGYSKPELLAALGGRPCKGFLASVREEVENEASHMNELVFLVRMPLGELLRLKSVHNRAEAGGRCDTRTRPDVGTVTIGKDAMCGLYDEWSGGGSLLGVELERDVQLPIKFLRKVLPDAELRPYGIESVYGMCRSAWRSVVKEIHKEIHAEEPLSA